MFSIREFILRGLINAIGKLADYQVILNAMGWYDKGILTEQDLEEINSKLQPVVEEPIEEPEEVEEL